MKVSGLATITLPPATRPVPVIVFFSCRDNSIRNFLANASTTCQPTLWRVRSDSGPGLPRPTMSFMRVLKFIPRVRRGISRCTGRIHVTFTAGARGDPASHARDKLNSMEKRQRIVVIDDSANDLQVTRRFLERRG